MDISHFTEAESDRLAACCLEALRRRYPHKLDHLILHADDHRVPGEIHPVFDGCYDWHSSVHMHWSLLRLRPAVEESALASEIDRHFDAHFTRELVGREREYAARPERAAFERPYGWAWLLKLQAELEAQRPAGPWTLALRPFATEVAARLGDFITRSRYPVRSGSHGNSAFAMLLARDYAIEVDDPGLLGAIDRAARTWFSRDEAFPAHYEPGGADFLSPGLCEALLMSRVLGDAFAPWWARFDGSGAATAHWLEPVAATDLGDPQLVHLAGLNLSRAWCLAMLADRVPREQRGALGRAAEAHWSASWAYVTTADFTATHWLLSFAMLCVEATTSRPTTALR